jgi:hypothetical protein
MNFECWFLWDISRFHPGINVEAEENQEEFQSRFELGISRTQDKVVTAI